MSQAPTRPFGLTLIVAVIKLQGMLAIIIGLNFIRVVELTALPVEWATNATGAAILIVGIAGIFALIQNGVNSENGPSLIPAVVSGVRAGHAPA